VTIHPSNRYLSGGSTTLAGMALQEGFPRYETLLGEGSRPGETRGTTGEEKDQGGPQQRPNPILYGTEMPNWYTAPLIPFLPAP
jgi:hypothetical protein